MNGVNGAVLSVKDPKNFVEHVTKQERKKLSERASTVEKMIAKKKKKHSRKIGFVRTTAKWMIGLLGPNGLVRKGKGG